VKVIGLIGGMSWQSTVPYYRLINEMVQDRLGVYHSAKIVLVSVDFSEIHQMQQDNRWDQAGALLAQAAATLETAGAGCVVLCTNTMHKVAPAIEAAVSIPLLHIADATGEEIRQAGLRSIGLLGTRFTMEQDFYRERLREKYGIDVLIPEQEDREIVHRVIFEELVRGRLLPESRDEYRRIIARLVDSGAQGVILGCTEISLLVNQDDSPVPLFDTTSIHAGHAVEWALA
jgi:aspartate racemase